MQERKEDDIRACLCFYPFLTRRRFIFHLSRFYFYMFFRHTVFVYALWRINILNRELLLFVTITNAMISFNAGYVPFHIQFDGLLVGVFSLFWFFIFTLRLERSHEIWLKWFSNSLLIIERRVSLCSDIRLIDSVEVKRFVDAWKCWPWKIYGPEDAERRRPSE